MNPAKNVTCATKGFSVGTMSGSGIPEGMVVFHTCRFVRVGKREKIVKVDRYGEVMTRAEAERHNLERGYSHHYGRNVCGFRQSRAARKRGYVCTHWAYLSATKYHAERLEKGN